MPMSDIERRDKSSGRQFISMAWCGAEYYGGNHGWGVSCSLCLPVKGWTCLRVHLSGLFYFELLIDIEIFEKMQVYAETNGQDFEEQSVYYQHGQADTADQQYIRQGDFGYPGEIRQVVSDIGAQE